MSGPLIIRAAGPHDIPAILDIQAEGRLSPWSAEAYFQALKDPDFYFYFAELGNNPVGFLLARLITSEFSSEILNLAILSQFQRQTTGGNLLDQFLDHVRKKVDTVFLEVREGNAKAIAFYKKHGFYEVGKRINYYSNPTENALVMEKKLN
jgi:[ribosomal protein S18]-alanine N-acetyltransferase